AEEIARLDSDLKVASVIDFPEGKSSPDLKAGELLVARDYGADEFDVVADYQALIAGDEIRFYNGILWASRAAKEQTLKVIFENYSLPDELKKKAYELAKRAFQQSGYTANRMFKTSTGFVRATDDRPTGATMEDLVLMAEVSGGEVGLKASGGVSDFASAAKAISIMHASLKRSGNNACQAQLLQTSEGVSGIDPSLFRIGTSSGAVFTPGRKAFSGY
ncbi:MAG: hypothetical protein AAF202_08465, partial [Pseudomonadota bacterium]